MKSKTTNNIISTMEIDSINSFYNLKKKSGWKAYFVTYKFHIPWNHQSRIFQNPYIDNIIKCWTEHNESYIHLMNHLEKRYNEKHDKMPQELAFIDFPETRNNNHQEYKLGTVPHIHSMIIIHPNHIARFEEMSLSDFKEIVGHPRLELLREIHAEPIGDEPTDFSWVAKYAGKFFDSYPASNDSALADVELYRKNPKKLYELKAYQRNINSLKVKETA